MTNAEDALEQSSKALEASLRSAAYDGDVKNLEKLIEKGVNLEARDSYKQTPLILAVRHGHETFVAALLKANVEVNAQDTYGQTALHHAAEWGFSKIISLLIAKGANLESRNDNGNTPLIFAVWKGHEDAIEVLLEGNADVNALGLNNWTALHYATEYHNTPKIISRLIAKGSNLDVTNKTGNTPLSLAAKNGHETAVAVLLQAKADANAPGENGDTALIFAAAKYDFPKIISLLIAEGANLEIQNKYGFTVLELAGKMASGSTETTANYLKILQALRPCLNPGNLQFLANLIEIRYLEKMPEDHLLCADRKLLSELMNTVLKEASSSLFTKHKQVISNAEKSLIDSKITRKELETALITALSNCLELLYLRPRIEEQFWQPYIELLLMELEGKDQTLFPELIPNICWELIKFTPIYSMYLPLVPTENGSYSFNDANQCFQNLIIKRVRWIKNHLEEVYKKNQHVPLMDEININGPVAPLIFSKLHEGNKGSSVSSTVSGPGVHDAVVTYQISAASPLLRLA